MFCCQCFNILCEKSSSKSPLQLCSLYAFTLRCCTLVIFSWFMFNSYVHYHLSRLMWYTASFNHFSSKTQFDLMYYRVLWYSKLLFFFSGMFFTEGVTDDTESAGEPGFLSLVLRRFRIWLGLGSSVAYFEFVFSTTGVLVLSLGVLLLSSRVKTVTSLIWFNDMFWIFVYMMQWFIFSHIRATCRTSINTGD